MAKDESPAIFDMILGQTPEPSEFADKILQAENASSPATEGNGDTTASASGNASFPNPPGMASVNIGDQSSSTNPPTDDSVFNPEIHAGGPDGKGIKTKSGKFRRKPGRKGSKHYDGGLNSPQAVEANPIDPFRMERAKQDAQIATALTFTLGVSMFGEEGKPVTDLQVGINEPEEFVVAYTQYFYMSGPMNLPPGMVLAMTFFNYSMRRYQMPQSRGKIQAMFSWVKSRVYSMIGWDE